MMIGTGLATAALAAEQAMAQPAPGKRPDQRLGQTYRFKDPDMDLFFVAALSWGPTGDYLPNARQIELTLVATRWRF